MSSILTNATDKDCAYEGGLNRSNAKYRVKCNFAEGRGGRLNKNQLQCARGFKVFLMIFNMWIILTCWDEKMNAGRKAFDIMFGTYSCWGVQLALYSQIASALACNYEAWFKPAYILTELSFAVNTVIMILFWLGSTHLLRPPFTYVRFAVIVSHLIPFVTTVSDLAMTDMALEKSHWWMTTLIACPFYMLANWFFSFRIGSYGIAGDFTTVYGFEMWTSNVPITMLTFFIGALVQGGLFYCLCSLIEKVWPKRPEEEFILDKVDSTFKSLDHNL